MQTLFQGYQTSGLWPWNWFIWLPQPATEFGVSAPQQAWLSLGVPWFHAAVIHNTLLPHTSGAVLRCCSIVHDCTCCTAAHPVIYISAQSKSYTTTCPPAPCCCLARAPQCCPNEAPCCCLPPDQHCCLAPEPLCCLNTDLLQLLLAPQIWPKSSPCSPDLPWGSGCVWYPNLPISKEAVTRWKRKST